MNIKNYSPLEKVLIISLIISIIFLTGFGIKITYEKFSDIEIGYSGGF